MRATMALGLLALLGACEDSQPQQDEFKPSTFASTATPMNSVEPYSIEWAPEPTPEPTPYYAEQDGLIYSYIAAVSEEDRKRGKRAGNVVSFAYLGVQNGRHVLVQVNQNGSVIGRSSCKNPCRVINNGDGTQTGYDERSIVGAAFADAIAGRMEIAQLSASLPSAATYAPPSTPTPEPAPPAPAANAADSWTAAEAGLISEWSRLNILCKAAQTNGGERSACEKRDAEIAPALAAANICYGRVYEDPTKSSLHRCTGDSLRLD